MASIIQRTGASVYKQHADMQSAVHILSHIKIVLIPVTSPPREGVGWSARHLFSEFFHTNMVALVVVFLFLLGESLQAVHAFLQGTQDTV